MGTCPVDVPPREPPQKKPRTDKQQALTSWQLPSPRVTLGSCTDNPASSSSSALGPGPAPRHEAIQSFRERFFPYAKKTPTSISPRKRSHRRSSIASIFRQRPAVAFEDEPTASSTMSADAKPRVRELTPDTDPEDMIKKLKSVSLLLAITDACLFMKIAEHYLDTAETLHERAAIQLQQAQADILRKLRQKFKGGETFLAELEKRNRKLCTPLSEFTIRTEHRDPADGTIRVEARRVGKLVTDGEAQLTRFEADIARLWQDWEAAHAEVRKGYRDTLVGVEMGKDGRGDMSRYTFVHTQLPAVIEKEIWQARKDADKLTDAAVAAMKEIEKVRCCSTRIGSR